MIYLFGGPPRGGKTILAETLAKKKPFPYFSLDHATSVVTPYIPEQEYKTKLPLRIARQETNYSNDIFYTKYSSEQIVDFYLRQAETYWPGVETFIKYAVQDEHDLILEGWQILPRLLHAAITSENQDKLKILFLYKTDIENIVSGIQANTAKNDWVIKNTKDESTFVAIAKMVSHFGNYIQAEAKKYNFQAVNTDFDFKQKINELAESL
jgi:2-phosphoglycerate kinase